ncbi:hypothetical protein GCM10010145_46740 [Streptomyces ruber]|uniref:Uncharacterized protein n=2 Tax=Streptomyces TaxID=1883 RepID=A0A918EUW7_9ACTN|nr:hypothetical protein GCM10010145_46740 [Streptomyces ruber]
MRSFSGELCRPSWLRAGAVGQAGSSGCRGSQPVGLEECLEALTEEHAPADVVGEVSRGSRSDRAGRCLTDGTRVR